MKPEFKTERLTLTPVKKSDSDTLYRIFTNEFVRRYLFDDEILTRSQVEELIAASERTFSAGNYGLWLAALRETGETVGFAGLWHFFDEPQPQLLYGLLPEFAGCGLATEAARRVVDYSFSELRFGHLDASFDAPNIASHRVAERLGMKMLKEERINGSLTEFYRLDR